MDAVKFLKEFNRMCKTYTDCAGCQFESHLYCTENPAWHTDATYESAVELLAQWLAEHPAKTRQSEFLKLFPNAKKEFKRDILLICPQSLDTGFQCPGLDCYECRRKYWGGEETK